MLYPVIARDRTNQDYLLVAIFDREELAMEFIKNEDEEQKAHPEWVYNYDYQVYIRGVNDVNPVPVYSTPRSEINHDR